METDGSGLGVISMLTASQINSLKASVKAEMARRSGYGSLAEFAGASYDFSTVPAAGGVIKAEHGQKTVNLILKVTDVNKLKNVNQGDILPDKLDSSVLTHVNTLKNESMTGSKSSCRGACTGLCLGTCTSTCSGCSGCSG